MCIIAVCIDRKLSLEEIDYGWTRNPDGGGIGWVESGRVNYIKGLMTLEDFKKEYENLNIRPHIVHFRNASKGIPVNCKLTHPFIVSKTSPIRLRYKGIKPVLFHNGTIRDWKRYYEQYVESRGIIIRDENLSDTMVMAIIWAEKGEDTFDLLNPGRVALLYPDGKIKKYGDWIEKKGIYLSNEQLLSCQ